MARVAELALGKPLTVAGGPVELPARERVRGSCSGVPRGFRQALSELAVPRRLSSRPDRLANPASQGSRSSFHRSVWSRSFAGSSLEPPLPGSGTVISLAPLTSGCSGPGVLWTPGRRGPSVGGADPNTSLPPTGCAMQASRSRFLSGGGTYSVSRCGSTTGIGAPQPVPGNCRLWPPSTESAAQLPAAPHVLVVSCPSRPTTVRPNGMLAWTAMVVQILIQLVSCRMLRSGINRYSLSGHPPFAIPR